MMRRLLVLLGALVLLGSLVPLAAMTPMAAVAQESTPPAQPEPSDAAQAAVPASTDVHIVLPFGPDGLHAGLNAAETVSGVCSFSSLMSTGRPDAWDCLDEANQIYDPCFENPYAPPDAPGALACFASPFSSDVVLLEVTEPLARDKAPGSASDVHPWDVPWALELANGDRCTVLADIGVVLAGESVYFACADGGTILGEVDRTRPLWTVHYLADGAGETTLVAVSAAWA